MTRNSLEKPNKSLFWNGIIFFAVVLLLVGLNIGAIVLLKDMSPIDAKIFVIDSAKDLAGSAAYGDINTNPLFFSFIEISSLPMWATYASSIAMIGILSSLIFITRRKTVVVFISIIVASLGSNISTVIHEGIAERTIIVPWLFDLKMNILDFIMLLSLPVFAIYEIIINVIHIKNAPAKEKSYSVSSMMKQKSPKIKKEKKSKDKEVEIIKPATVKLEDDIRPNTEVMRERRKQGVVDGGLGGEAIKAEPVKVEPVVEKQIIKIDKVVEKPKPVVNKKEVTQPIVIKQAKKTTVKPKTQEEIDEEEMRKSLEALRDSF